MVEQTAVNRLVAGSNPARGAILDIIMSGSSIKLTKAAAKRIQEITCDISNKNHGKTLLISVQQGGCAGFRYKYKFIKKAKSTDILVKNGNVYVAIDDFSAKLLKGAVIDYVETSEFGTAAFEIKNPNASGCCSCGNSFAI